MRHNFKFKLLILLPLLLISVETFARAGGGGGNGRGTIIGLIIGGIYTLIISVILFVKQRQSQKVLERCSTSDLLWDMNEMKDVASNIFFMMQDAWMSRNLVTVKELITPRLYDDYKIQLDLMLKNREQNILSNIHISKIHIIGCEDYLNDSQDSFVAYIKGSILDYTINEKSGEIIKNSKKENERFADTYHFIRKDDMWLLNQIDNDISIFEVLKTKNFHENQ
jgi:hypothetical protein